MNSVTRIWALACGAGTVAVLAGGWFLGVQPALAAVSSTTASTASVDAQNQATQVRLASLSRAAAKTDQLEAQNAVLLKAVPTVLKPNTLIRRINEVAALDDVTVAAVQLSASAPYSAPLADGSTALSLAKTDASITASNFTAVPVSIQVTGTADATLQFAHDIQNDERVFAIDSVQTSTDDSDVVSATFGGYIYVLKR